MLPRRVDRSTGVWSINRRTELIFGATGGKATLSRRSAGSLPMDSGIADEELEGRKEGRKDCKRDPLKLALILEKVRFFLLTCVCCVCARARMRARMPALSSSRGSASALRGCREYYSALPRDVMKYASKHARGWDVDARDRAIFIARYGRRYR